MNRSKLYSAIRARDVGKVQYLFISEPEKCFLSGDGREVDPAVIECIKSQSAGTFTQKDKEDTTRCRILEILVQNGADVNLPSCCANRMTATHFAAKWGYLKCLRFLTESGADLNMISRYGETALMCAVIQEQVECVKYLVKGMSSSGMNCVDEYGMTALMHAASTEGEQRFVCVQLIVEAGANVDLSNIDGNTALMLAAEEECVKSVEYLAQHTSSWALNHKNVQGKTALMMLVSVRRSSVANKLCVHHLLKAEPSLSVEDNEGNTALKLAIQAGNVEAVTSLLANGALLNARVNKGRTPFDFAIDGNNVNIILKLLHCGAVPIFSRRRQDGLHKMVIGGSNEVVQALVTKGFPALEFRFDKDFITHQILRTHLPNLSLSFKKGLVRHLATKPLSALAVAILCERVGCARYFIVNRFFTRSDLVWLCWDPKVQQFLQTVGAKQSLGILQFLAARPQSLLTLSLVALSSALSQDLVPGRAYKQLEPKSKTFSNLAPGFKEKVESLAIPPALARLLLHQTSSSKICCQDWGDIPLTLGEDKSFTDY
ncbi:ankyrin [Elysia marginata]|uniref:Ankyrin n=1 Tax=Elysia marginata TaxID=1093978 RepID=A0AAV4F3G4_9GAST|nr:ankyrin [Elysia marginata]